MKSTSDDELVQRCLEAKQASADAFAELYDRHAGPLLAFLVGFHRGDEHSAHDALQEAFFRFHTALPSFQQGRALRPWLYRIARNVSLDMFKRKGAETAVLDPTVLGVAAGASAAPSPAEQASQKEAVGLLRRVVLELPRQELAVFLLKHDQGLTYAQVADALSCSVRTAKYRMKAALEHIGREAERQGVQA
ncbi:RNA polymerase sigma factor [Planctomycetota bacterium]|nr:RNA polymerase sigma factor [Planctomycetota bacterium]